MADVADRMVELNKMLLEVKRNPAFKLTVNDSQKLSTLIQNGLHKSAGLKIIFQWLYLHQLYSMM